MIRLFYQQALSQGFEQDDAQAVAVAELQRCFDQLLANGTPQGVYLWGPVGRGKTWLMNGFHHALDQSGIPSRRQHFHHFMAWLHQRLFALTGTPNPLQQVARILASDVRVLCFDEFFISDIGDAMLLGPLLQALLAEGLVLVATSNEAPGQLYAQGFNRERVLPALDALQQQVVAVHLGTGQDHRLHGEADTPRYWLQDQAPGMLAKLFLTLTGEAAQSGSLDLQGRQLAVLGMSEQVLWCSYQALCEGHWSAHDYIRIGQHFRHILLSDVPALGAPTEEQRIARGTEDGARQVQAGDRPLTPLSRHDNSVRRFIALVDECYEQGIPLYIEAAVPLAQLYREGALLFPFQRTLSRLQEMQRSVFGKGGLRQGQTGLT